jgi:hypothetical protein
MSQPYDFPQIGANPVICGVIYKDSPGIGIAGYRFLYIIKRHSERNAELVINTGIDVYRYGTA